MLTFHNLHAARYAARYSKKGYYTTVILAEFSYFNKKKKKEKSLAPIKKLRIKTTTKNSLYDARKRNNKSKHIATGQQNQTLNLKSFFGKIYKMQKFLKQ